MDFLWRLCVNFHRITTFGPFKSILNHDEIMAKVIGESITGMIGPVVYVNFNGKKYIRMAPRARKKGSWSEKQKMHR